ncbi:TPA: helix-turn-helix transcriptional regulator [Streptococcus equi subsp. zooepidemicus]|nr:helix-turn-helix transcriptional regulator [Streptococcus equi subsp. zooepidemicus]HEL0596064.1 helix-turn-helix transcriptional regulator [Streptococcus equi subsp. zooepidemicus]HEL0703927.1 helix-turn-helix transcriptional regulator [Streptococcus equi subsp. zooepidemicus]HEL0719335.1 helix-turn-helix transcriptional regulator [Streptococcus equi subsp. zooepidemicus]HEL0817556.1 helix-turn-helix transcriptional regulator [Streptococcus equi subsp. zooepidemicus]
MFSTFELVKQLCKKNGISLNYLEDKLGYSRNTLYKLKSQKPNAERIAEIADYFNVSTDYLLGRTDNPNIAKDTYLTPSGKEMDLAQLADGVMLFDGKPLTDEEKITIQGIIKGYLDSRKG